MVRLFPRIAVLPIADEVRGAVLDNPMVDPLPIDLSIRGWSIRMGTGDRG